MKKCLFCASTYIFWASFCRVRDQTSFWSLDDSLDLLRPKLPHVRIQLEASGSFHQLAPLVQFFQSGCIVYVRAQDPYSRIRNVLFYINVQNCFWYDVLEACCWQLKAFFTAVPYLCLLVQNNLGEKPSLQTRLSLSQPTNEPQKMTA